MGRRGAVAFLALLVGPIAGCGTGSGDNPAFSVPSTAAPATPAPSGSVASISYIGEGGVSVPQLAGAAAANATLLKVGAGLDKSCRPETALNSATTASFVWKCQANHVATATVTVPGGQLVALSDLMQGDYESYLQSVAQAQLQADNATNTDTSDLSFWYLKPNSLVIVFPGGAVQYPGSSLTQYLKGPLPA